MKAFDAPTRRIWLYALPMAWVTSALLLLDQSRLLYVLACLGWVALAWECLAGARLYLARRALALVLALAVPLQGFALTAVETRGPAHVHATPAESHWHGDVRHHHHAPGESILLDDGMRERQQSLAGAEDKRLAFGGADSIAPSQPAIPSQEHSGAPPDNPRATRPTPIITALERPPQLPLVSLPQ
jgi:hypothetical protein